MRGTLEWNEKGIKWLFDLLLKMVYVQGFGLSNGQDHEAVLINNYVRVGGGTIFYWESENPKQNIPSHLPRSLEDIMLSVQFISTQTVWLHLIKLLTMSGDHWW